MAKIFEINIGHYFEDKVLKIIREKEDIIVLLLETIKMFLVGNIIKDDQRKGKVILKIDKMSRVIFEIKDKYISFNFPFSIETRESEDEYFRIYDSNIGIDIDNKIVSIILGLISQNILSKDSLEELYYELSYTENVYDLDTIWNLLRKLILFESGYLRYDYDPVHENGTMHPLNHFDFYFSSGNTLKVGLDSKITIEDFISILDVQTECHFMRRI